MGEKNQMPVGCRGKRVAGETHAFLSSSHKGLVHWQVRRAEVAFLSYGGTRTTLISATRDGAEDLSVSLFSLLPTPHRFLSLQRNSENFSCLGGDTVGPSSGYGLRATQRRGIASGDTQSGPCSLPVPSFQPVYWSVDWDSTTFPEGCCGI